MALLQQSNSRRFSRLKRSASIRKRENQAEQETTMARIPRREAFESIDEAVVEHRKSMAARSKSAGGDKHASRRRCSPRRTTPAAAREAAAMLREQPRSSPRHVDLLRPGQTIEYKTGSDSFAFPTPSPRMPPRSATFQYHRYAPPSPGKVPRSATFQDRQYLGLDDGSQSIGMAIGSPSQAPPAWKRSYTASIIPRRAPAGLPPTHSPPAQNANSAGRPEVKRKYSGWRAFGNMFRKAPTRSEEPFYKVKPEVHPEHISNHVKIPSTDAEILKSQQPEKVASWLSSPSPAWHKWSHSRTSSQNVDHSLSSPHADTRQSPTIQRTAAAPKKARREHVCSPRMRSPLSWHAPVEDCIPQTDNQPASSMETASQTKPIPLPPMPRLDLDLPELSFPRYSIMFEKLLANDGRPSLLERRQSKLQRTKSCRASNGDNLHVDTKGSGVMRSKTSPSLTRPSLLQEQHQRQHADSRSTLQPADARPSMQRSRTAPSGTIPTITTGLVRDRGNTHLSSSPESPFGSTFHSENSLPPTPTTVTTCTDTDSVHHILDDTDRGWCMLEVISSKPSLPPKSNSYNTSNSFSTPDAISPQHLQQHLSDQYPRIQNREQLERKMVQVSVARQVSVSRARSRVQKALDPRATPAAVPLRPRIVEFSRNRKSAAASLVLDDAESADVEGRTSFSEERYGPMPVGAAKHSREASLAFEEALREKRKSTAGSLKSVRSDRSRRRRSCSARNDKRKSYAGSVVLAIEAEEVVSDFEFDDDLDDDSEGIPDVPAVPEEIRKSSVASVASSQRQQVETASKSSAAAVRAKPGADGIDMQSVHPLFSNPPSARETIHVRLEGPAARDSGKRRGGPVVEDVTAQIDDAIDAFSAGTARGGEGKDA